MARSSWDGRSEQDKDAAFELLDQKSTLGSIDNDWTPSTSRLPPKNLPLRTTSQVVRTLFWTGAIAVGLIAGISVLASDLFYFLPYTDSLQIKGGVSCDLRTGQAGTLQDAFTLNLRASTHLSFTEAKAIDVIWQLFVGAGGRFWLAWISYKVFMDGLARLTEKSPISYNLYASLTFSTTTLWTTYYALKGVFFAKGWRCKFFLLWFGISTLYVLGFPTLMSATAGYVIPSTSGFKMSDGVFLTPDSESLTSCFEVHDGALIGLTNETLAPGPPVSQYNAMYPNTSDISKPFDSLGIPSFNKSYPLFASLLNSTYSYAFSRRIYDATNDTIPWNRTFQGPDTDMDYEYTSNITIMGHMYRFRNYLFIEDLSFEPAYCYQNHSIPDLMSLAECLPEKFFVWGFSSLMVYINLGLLMIWIFGMYIVWLDANIYSALCRSGRKVRGDFRAVTDLSEAMKEVLGTETCAYSDRELARELSTQPGIQYYASDLPDDEVSHIGLSSLRLGRVQYNSTKLYGKYEKNR